MSDENELLFDPDRWQRSVGKTVKAVAVEGSYSDEITISFTDGTALEVHPVGDWDGGSECRLRWVNNA